jgi:hypothetical protein
MKYQIKNLTGDPTNANPDLRLGRRLYATSANQQNVLPINPQETAFVSDTAMVELTTNYPTWVSVLDSDGSADDAIAFRTKYTLTGAWQYIDLGRFTGLIQITNIDSSAPLLQFSFSGNPGALGAGGDPTIGLSDVLVGETITINSTMDPIRYLYIKGGSGKFAYILVN